MKIKYLSEKDKQTLHELRHTDEMEDIAELLEGVLKRQPSVHTLWEYRKWFLRLNDEQLQKRPSLTFGLIQIYILSGELKKAKAVLDTLPQDVPYYLFAKLMYPGIEREEREDAIRKIKQLGYFPEPKMVLTAGRPSVLNGIWDLTPYADNLHTDKNAMLEQLTSIFGETATTICEVAYAESLYYQDKCYEALVKVVGLTQFLKEKHEMQLLFVALTLEVFVMVQNGQTPSTIPMMENLRKQIKDAGMEEFLSNVAALDAWAAMYDGDYKRVFAWMREEAPDEYGKFCMLDLFGYMIKMRAYIIQGKYLAVTALATKLLPLLEAGHRYMDLCELHMIWAMSDYASDRKWEAFKHLEIVLELSEKYHYDRLLADEGKRMHELLREYRSEKTKSPYLAWVTELTEKSAALFPRYLKNQLPEKPALTEAEMRILRLLKDSYTNAQIAEEVGIAQETAKKHCKHIIAKLEVKNRYQAVQRAIEYGIIEPG